MSTRIFLYMTCLFVLSCGNKLIEEPGDLIPADRMVEILYDMALLDAIDNSHPQVIAENDLQVMEFLFEKYGIDSLQFVQSDRYYASLPVEYRRIYETVEARLTRARDSISAIIQQENPADSLDREEDYD